MQQDSRTGRKDIAAGFGYSQATPLLPVPSFWLHLLGSCPQPQRRVGCAPCHSPWPPKDAAPPLTVHLKVGVCPSHCRAVGKPTGHLQPSGKKVTLWVFLEPSSFSVSSQWLRLASCALWTEFLAWGRRGESWAQPDIESAPAFQWKATSRKQTSLSATWKTRNIKQRLNISYASSSACWGVVTEP